MSGWSQKNNLVFLQSRETVEKWWKTRPFCKTNICPRLFSTREGGCKKCNCVVDNPAGLHPARDLHLTIPRLVLHFQPPWYSFTVPFEKSACSCLANMKMLSLEKEIIDPAFSSTWQCIGPPGRARLPDSSFNSTKYFLSFQRQKLNVSKLLRGMEIFWFRPNGQFLVEKDREKGFSI